MMPHLPPNEVGYRDTDPDGLIFINKSPSGEYIIPNIATDPGVEPWKGADTDADGNESQKEEFNLTKLKKDVHKRAEVEEFSVEAKSEWDALFEFHERYQTPESIPLGPITLQRACDGTKLTMAGTNISWRHMWSVLCRLPRPHRMEDADSAKDDEATDGRASGCAHERNTCSDAPTIVLPNSLHNNITGTNYPRATRERERRIYMGQATLHACPAHTHTPARMHFQDG